MSRGRAVRTAFDTVLGGLPPALELSRDPPNLRRYPLPVELDPYEHREEEPADHDPRSDEQWFEDEQAYHGSDRR